MKKRMCWGRGERDEREGGREIEREREGRRKRRKRRRRRY